MEKVVICNPSDSIIPFLSAGVNLQFHPAQFLNPIQPKSAQPPPGLPRQNLRGFSRTEETSLFLLSDLYLSLGSNISLKVSPDRLKASTNKANAVPGNTHMCGEVVKYARPPLSITPHSGAGG